MPVSRTEPYKVGETAYLASPGGEWVHVVSPDGTEVKYRHRDRPPLELVLDQPGQWTYHWDHGEEGVLDVVPASLEAAPVAKTPRWPAARGV